jgi:hypothetical protein
MRGRTLYPLVHAASARFLIACQHPNPWLQCRCFYFPLKVETVSLGLDLSLKKLRECDRRPPCLPGDLQVVYFDCNQWLSKDHSDGRLERTLEASSADPSFSRCSYQVHSWLEICLSATEFGSSMGHASKGICPLGRLPFMIRTAANDQEHAQLVYAKFGDCLATCIHIAAPACALGRSTCTPATCEPLAWRMARPSAWCWQAARAACPGASSSVLAPLRAPSRTPSSFWGQARALQESACLSLASSLSSSPSVAKPWPLSCHAQGGAACDEQASLTPQIACQENSRFACRHRLLHAAEHPSGGPRRQGPLAPGICGGPQPEDGRARRVCVPRLGGQRQQHGAGCL